MENGIEPSTGGTIQGLPAGFIFKIFSINMILMPFELFLPQTGVGNKGKWGDAICSINSVLNLCTICQFDEAVVEYFILGMCQVG